MFSSARFYFLTALASCAVTTVTSSGIIVPLYIFPGSSPACSAWSALNTAYAFDHFTRRLLISLFRISANPSLPFYVIVNPDSGPGAANSQPDASSYQGCIPQLKSHSNVKIVGYVPTGSGSRSQSAVNTDVATYAGWAAAYRPDGIFFDEVKPTSKLLSKYITYASTAKQSFDNGNGFVSNSTAMSLAPVIFTHVCFR